MLVLFYFTIENIPIVKEHDLEFVNVIFNDGNSIKLYKMFDNRALYEKDKTNRSLCIANWIGRMENNWMFFVRNCLPYCETIEKLY